MRTVNATLVEAMKTPSRFRATAEAAAGDIRAARDMSVASIRAGRLGVVQARESLKDLAARTRAALTERAASYGTLPPQIGSLIANAVKAKAVAHENLSGDALARETAATLKALLLETQLTNRRAEFESGARRLALINPGDPLTPESVLAFLPYARNDPAAAAWAKRQLQASLPDPMAAETREAVERATTEAGDVNDRAVQAHLADLGRMDANQRVAFIEGAVAAQDASACTAAYVLCQRTFQEAEHGTNWLPWQSRTLALLTDGRYPANAVDAVAAYFDESAGAESRAAMLAVEAVMAQADQLADLAGVESPSSGDLARDAYFEGRGKPGKDYTQPEN